MSDRAQRAARTQRRPKEGGRRWPQGPAGKTLAGCGLLLSLLLGPLSGEVRATDPADSAAAAIGLAIQGISLMNGEDGIELWRLKATWGHLSQDGDTVTVDKPVVRYTLGDPALKDYLHVRADQGRITDTQRYLKLWDNVVLTRGEETVTGTVLDYDAKTRVLVFPDGAALAGPKGALRTDVLTWKLDDNILSADGHVDVLLRPRADTEDAADSVQTEPAPSEAAKADAPAQQAGEPVASETPAVPAGNAAAPAGSAQ